MFRFSALILAALTLSAGATDLTPHFLSTMSEGVVVRRPYFADGTKKFGIKVDSETKLTAFEGGAMFRFDKFPEASVRWRSSPLPAESGFAPEAIPRYEQAARTLLPAEATAVELVESELNPSPINNWQGLRLTFSYRTVNSARRQSITFLNLKPTEQIVIQAAASDTSFAEVSARAFNSLRHWHEMDPGEESPFN